MAKHGNVLLLGMVFSSEAIPKRGQEYRDRVRCEALEGLNYKVKTLDNKHSDITLSNHCTANFSDTRRMVKAISNKWGSETFDHVILDYFMSPVKKTAVLCSTSLIIAIVYAILTMLLSTT